MADASGEFVAIFDLPPSTVPQVLSLAMVLADGREIVSPDVMVLSPRLLADAGELAQTPPGADVASVSGGGDAAGGHGSGDVAQGQPLGLVADGPSDIAGDTVRPDPDTEADGADGLAGRLPDGARVSEGAPGPAVFAQPETVAAEADGDGDGVAQGPVPAPVVPEVLATPEIQVPDEGLVAGPGPSGVAQAGTDAVPLAFGAAPSEGAALVPPPDFLLDREGQVRVLDDPGQRLANVVIDTLSYAPDGGVQVAGRTSQPGAETLLRIYLNNRAVVTVQARGGVWSADLTDVPPGLYTLRVDETDAAGQVVSRFETPFLREDPVAVARLHAADGTQTRPEPRPVATAELLAGVQDGADGHLAERDTAAGRGEPATGAGDAGAPLASRADAGSDVALAAGGAGGIDAPQPAGVAGTQPRVPAPDAPVMPADATDPADAAEGRDAGPVIGTVADLGMPADPMVVQASSDPDRDTAPADGAADQAGQHGGSPDAPETDGRLVAGADAGQGDFGLGAVRPVAQTEADATATPPEAEARVTQTEAPVEGSDTGSVTGSVSGSVAGTEGSAEVPAQGTDAAAGAPLARAATQESATVAGRVTPVLGGAAGTEVPVAPVAPMDDTTLSTDRAGEDATQTDTVSEAIVTAAPAMTDPAGQRLAVPSPQVLAAAPPGPAPAPAAPTVPDVPVPPQPALSQPTPGSAAPQTLTAGDSAIEPSAAESGQTAAIAAPQIAPAPVPAQAGQPPAVQPAQPRVALITVQPGQSLWRISHEHYGEGARYVQIFSANRSQIRNPDLIYPGQIFALPD